MADARRLPRPHQRLDRLALGTLEFRLRTQFQWHFRNLDRLRSAQPEDELLLREGACAGYVAECREGRRKASGVGPDEDRRPRPLRTGVSMAIDRRVLAGCGLDLQVRECSLVSADPFKTWLSR